MNRFLRTAACAVAVSTIGSVATAQGGPGGPPPALMAKFKAWQKWRDNHKHISELTQTLVGFGEMDKDKSTQLTKDQARKIMPVLKTWRNKPVMSDDQALQVNKQLTASLTKDQLMKIATAPMPGRGGRGFGGGQQRGQGAGGRGMPDPSKFPDPADFNPLNPDSSPFAKLNPEMSSRMKQRFESMFKSIEDHAK